MPEYEVEVVMEDNHLFVITVTNVLNIPVPGALIKCDVCGRMKHIRTVGIPGKRRVQETPFKKKA